MTSPLFMQLSFSSGLSQAWNDMALWSGCKAQLCSRGWSVLSSSGPFPRSGSGCGQTIAELGQLLPSPCPLFTSSFFFNMRKRPAKLVCSLLTLLSFHPFPARPEVADGAPGAMVDSPRPRSAPGLLVPVMLSWNPLTSSAST